MEHLTEILITILTSGFFALVGFVWRFSHKVTKLEEQIKRLEDRLRAVENDADKALDRMYSMNKSYNIEALIEKARRRGEL
jgi:hypothetical protein